MRSGVDGDGRFGVAPAGGTGCQAGVAAADQAGGKGGREITQAVWVAAGGTDTDVVGRWRALQQAGAA